MNITLNDLIKALQTPTVQEAIQNALTPTKKPVVGKEAAQKMGRKPAAPPPPAAPAAPAAVAAGTGQRGRPSRWVSYMKENYADVAPKFYEAMKEWGCKVSKEDIRPMKDGDLESVVPALKEMMILNYFDKKGFAAFEKEISDAKIPLAFIFTLLSGIEIDDDKLVAKLVEFSDNSESMKVFMEEDDLGETSGDFDTGEEEEEEEEGDEEFDLGDDFSFGEEPDDDDL